MMLMSNRWQQRVLGLLSRIRTRFSRSDFVPAPTLQALNQLQWNALDSDPSFRLRFTLSPGWYQVRLRIRTHHITAQQPHGIAQIYLDSGQGESETLSWLIPYRNDQLSQGVFEVIHRSACRFDPIEHEGRFDLVELELRRITHDQAKQQSPLALTPDYRKDHPPLKSYAAWLSAIKVSNVAPLSAPTVAVFVHGHTGDSAALMQTLDSVRAQSHTGWLLYGVGMGDAWQACPQAWREAWLADPRFHWVPERASNSGPLPGRDLQTSGVNWCWWLPVGDQLAPQALAAVVQAIQSSAQTQVVYTDQDFIDRHGLRCNPYFKPDWSPDLFEQFEYTGRASVWHRSVWEGLSWPSDDDNPLAVLNPCLMLLPPEHIVHASVLVYHQTWTGGNDPDALTLTQSVGAYKPYGGQRVLVHTPRVSIIIPTRDARHLLAQCIDSIHTKTSYQDYEIIVVDNGSTDPDSLAYFDELQIESEHRVRVLRVDGPFNYSAINNAAVSVAQGDVLVFLNNDIEITTPNWLQEMVFWATRPGVGCVGAKLHFPNHRIQHAGIVLGMGGVAGHAHRGEPSDSLGYFARLIMVHNVTAVTGAAMAVQKQIFERAGRFDEEQLPVAYNDVDLCLKVRALGCRNVYTPWAQMLHHESATRGEDTDPVKRQRLANEEARLRQRWGHIIDADPMYNRHLSLQSEYVELATP